MYATAAQPQPGLVLSSFFFHVDDDYVRVTVVNGLRIMTIV